MRAPPCAARRRPLRPTHLHVPRPRCGRHYFSSPRVHKAVLKRGDTQSLNVKDRLKPLMECTDEQLLAEIVHRNIKLHDQVTRDTIHKKYTFGKMLGQARAASAARAPARSSPARATAPTPLRLHRDRASRRARRRPCTRSPTTRPSASLRARRARRPPPPRTRSPPVLTLPPSPLLSLSLSRHLPLPRRLSRRMTT